MTILSSRIIAGTFAAFVLCCLAPAFGVHLDLDGASSAPRLEVTMFQVTPVGIDTQAILDVENPDNRIATNCRVLWYDSGPGRTPTTSKPFALVGGAKKRISVLRDRHSADDAGTLARVFCSNRGLTEIAFDDNRRWTN